MENSATAFRWIDAEKQLQSLTQSFEALVQSCPPEASARQRVLTERRDGYLWIEIRTTFKVPLGHQD